MATGYVRVSGLELMGKKFDIHVTTGGHWHVVAEGQDPSDYERRLASGETREALIEALKIRLRKERTVLAIPFVYQTEYAEPQRGVARGVHQTSGEVLVTWASGEKGKLSRYHHAEHTLAELSADEWLELQQLTVRCRQAHENLKALEKPLAAFVKQHKIDLRGQLDKALQAEIVNTPELTVVEGGKE